jgi:spore coat polysaccharide biosynthesis protein SpsF
MMDLGGEPVLARVVARARRARLLDEVVVATTGLEADNIIVDFCAAHGWPWFRGSEEDVLDRYYRTATAFGADIVVRITSDCPLIDAEIIDLVVQRFLNAGSADYASNTLPPRTFPRGLDVEAMSFAALAAAWREDDNRAWREHVTPYIYRHPEKFRLLSVTNDVDYSHMRWTVDTSEDLALVRNVYGYFGPRDFNWRDALHLLEGHPEWLEINRHVVQKQVP